MKEMFFKIILYTVLISGAFSLPAQTLQLEKKAQRGL